MSWRSAPPFTIRNIRSAVTREYNPLAGGLRLKPTGSIASTGRTELWPQMTLKLENDAEALRAAKKTCRGLRCEVWDRDRLVGRIAARPSSA